MNSIYDSFLNIHNYHVPENVAIKDWFITKVFSHFVTDLNDFTLKQTLPTLLNRDRQLFLYYIVDRAQKENYFNSDGMISIQKMWDDYYHGKPEPDLAGNDLAGNEIDRMFVTDFYRDYYPLYQKTINKDCEWDISAI